VPSARLGGSANLTATTLGGGVGGIGFDGRGLGESVSLISTYECKRRRGAAGQCIRVCERYRTTGRDLSQLADLEQAHQLAGLAGADCRRVQIGVVE
jgi:hypothetical protein